MADNIKDGPERTLTFLVGHDVAGKGGKQAVGTWATKVYVDSTFATAAALSALDGDLDTLAGSVSALDATNFKLSGTQTAAGTKTFSGAVFISSGDLRLTNNVATILMGGSGDLALYREAADTLAQRRTTNAQAWRLYNTFTSATNYERLTISWASNVCTIKTEAQTGTRRPLQLGLTPQTVAALPSFTEGGIMFVNDALDPVFGKAVIGGGSVRIPVYADQADWMCGASVAQKEAVLVAVSDETTPLTTGTSKVKFRMPYAMTVTTVKASLNVAQSSGNILTIDINEAGTTILSTKLTIDNTETTSTTAAAPAVISDAALGNDAEITVDIDQVGAAADAAGLKITLIGYRA